MPSRRISMLQNQAFKRRSTREWPHNAYGKHHRAKVSAAFVIEAAALSFAGAGNLPGLLRALRISDTAWLQFKLPESRSPPFRVLTCSPRGLFFCGTDAMRPPQPERWEHDLRANASRLFRGKTGSHPAIQVRGRLFPDHALEFQAVIPGRASARTRNLDGGSAFRARFAHARE